MMTVEVAIDLREGAMITTANAGVRAHRRHHGSPYSRAPIGIDAKRWSRVYCLGSSRDFLCVGQPTVYGKRTVAGGPWTMRGRRRRMNVLRRDHRCRQGRRRHGHPHVCVRRRK